MARQDNNDIWWGNSVPQTWPLTTAGRDKTTINYQYIYHIEFWLLDNSTTLLAPNK